MGIFNRAAKEEPIVVQQQQGSILCEGLTFKGGNLEGVGKITINCYFVGNIKTNDQVVVGEAGCIMGDIEAHSIVILGNVEGNLEAVENVHIRSGGILNGNIRCASLEISTGAAFSGECNMTASKKENNILHNMTKLEAKSAIRELTDKSQENNQPPSSITPPLRTTQAK
ncbi:MAG: polymer-forming cytoskeletal protein [Defluviitaleaceae bacterium]|nr:polymer-forming cytoskeletal protein [Defluviitaleaceae bacterium]